MTNEAPFELSIDLAVLDDLGMNLYSNTPAVLTEAVANSYDADAERVIVTIDVAADRIVIEDDGLGMSRAEINSKYLMVGYKRRKDTSAPKKTPKHGRSPMGRKGIGKLSLFSLADTIHVESAKGNERNGCILSAQEIRSHIESNANTPYTPTEIPTDQITIAQGTRITLSKLKKERVSTAHLRVRLARRFSVIGTEIFLVEINGEPVEAHLRLGSVPFLFSFSDDQTKDLFNKDAATKYFPAPGLPLWMPQWGEPRGWLGVVKQRNVLTRPGESLNTVPVLARGRLCIEDLLDHLDDGRLITKYMSGQIVADFLDDDEHDDIVTSNRQQVRENDERYTSLLSYIKSLVTPLENERNERLDEDAKREITDQYPRIAEWLGGLKAGTQKEAKRMLSRLPNEGT